MSKTLDFSSDIKDLAEEAAGNWKKFDSFSWYGGPDDADRYMLYTASSRDSGLTEQSNADAIEKELKKFKDVRFESHGHWAVGHVNAIAIPVYDKKGKITAAFKKFVELMKALENYPILDEEDASRREYEATIENIESEGGSLVDSEAPKDWAAQVFSWLWDNEQDEVENRDDQGGYPSKESIKRALADLDFLEKKDYKGAVDEIRKVGEETGMIDYRKRQLNWPEYVYKEIEDNEDIVDRESIYDTENEVSKDAIWQALKNLGWLESDYIRTNPKKRR